MLKDIPQVPLYAQTKLSCFDSLLKTLEHHYELILNYFDQRLNSGFIEGLNNKIKVIKRRCYGLFNLKNLFQRIYLDLNGFELYF
ncbi:MAG: transposase [SAR324 cluster bacterium]|nr:transposase [SAR324 cluster bacterium]